MSGIGQGHNRFITCMDCPHRNPGCHDHCEGYKFRKKEADKKREKLKENKYKERDANCVTFKDRPEPYRKAR